MPYRRRFNERDRRRRSRFPPSDYKSSQQLIRYDPRRQRRGFFPIPNLSPMARVVKLRYGIASGDAHAMYSAAGSPVEYAFRANGMYDPYAGAGGHQPRGFDQYMALYRHYVVFYSRIKLRFFFGEESTSNPMKVGVYLRDTTTALASALDTSEFPRTRQGVLTTQTPEVKISMGFNARKIFHVKDPGDEPNLHGTAGADPSQIAAWNVFAYALSAGTETCYFTGYIDYIAVLLTPIEPSSS